MLEFCHSSLFVEEALAAAVGVGERVAARVVCFVYLVVVAWARVYVFWVGWWVLNSKKRWERRGLNRV